MEIKLQTQFPNIKLKTNEAFINKQSMAVYKLVTKAYKC